MSSSRKINHASGAATAPKTWPASVTSPSTSSAPCQAKPQSRENANSLPGIPAIFYPPLASMLINLDSLPWRKAFALDFAREQFRNPHGLHAEGRLQHLIARHIRLALTAQQDQRLADAQFACGT